MPDPILISNGHRSIVKKLKNCVNYKPDDSSGSKKQNVESAKKLIDRFFSLLDDIDTSDRQKLWSLLLDIETDSESTDSSLWTQSDPELSVFVHSLVSVNAKHAFKSFLTRRNAEKRRVYRSVVLLGFGVMTIGIGLYFLSSLFAPLTFKIIGTFGRVFGFVIYSSVPTNEYDLFYMMSKRENRLTKILISLVLGLFLTIAPFFYIQMESTASSSSSLLFDMYPNLVYGGFIFTFIGLWFLSNFRVVAYETIVYQFSSIVVIFTLVWGILCLGTFVWRDFFIFSCHTFVFLLELVVIYHIHRQKSHSSSTSESTMIIKAGWGADQISKCVFLLYFCFGLDFFANAFHIWAEGKSPIESWLNFLCGLADIFPLLLLLVLTPKKAFTLLAKIYEEDINKRTEDGAFMSALVQFADVGSKNSDYVWIMRACSDGALQVALKPEVDLNGVHPRDQVDRGLWMLGKLSRPRCQHQLSETGQVRADKINKLVVTVSYRDDIDPTWGCHYHAAKLEKLTNMTVHDYDDDSGLYRDNQFIKDLSYEDWKEQNFGRDILTASTTKLNLGESITWDFFDVGMSIKDRTIQALRKRQEVLKAYALENLRVYSWPGDSFDEELLTKSPRDMKDDAEKEKTFKLSKQITSEELSEKKIDFFISHSWSDDPKLKIAALKEFSNKFKADNGRYPTYWFDKVCIDQQAPNDGIAVLPINIGACDRVLVLLGSTYMKRLWCIWELFTLFTFSNRELAIDRINIIRLVDTIDVEDEIMNFSINEAHCFDPNEEFKLRHLMIDIIGQTGNNVEDLLKRLRLHEGRTHYYDLLINVPRKLSLSVNSFGIEAWLHRTLLPWHLGQYSGKVHHQVSVNGEPHNQMLSAAGSVQDKGPEIV